MFKSIFKKISTFTDQVKSNIGQIFQSNPQVDESFWKQFEETLIRGDVSVKVVTKCISNIKSELRKDSEVTVQTITKLLEEQFTNILPHENDMLLKKKDHPQIIICLGVNGSGKTTSIAKLANYFKSQGQNVLVVAADTFRAGASEQLDIWAQRVGVDIISNPNITDPGAIVYEATKTINQESKYHTIIIDTAGRLHTKKHLMDELAKLCRIVEKQIKKSYDLHKMLVLDATNGCNGISQVKMFFENTGIDSLFLTKLDSIAKGGVVFSLYEELHMPISFIGTGESVNDIHLFNRKKFVSSLFS